MDLPPVSLKHYGNQQGHKFVYGGGNYDHQFGCVSCFPDLEFYKRTSLRYT